MITLPRRSVTRFFIPLIDVLILLFCIFLLLPFVSTARSDADAKADTAPPPAELPTDVKTLQDRVRQLEAQLTDVRDQRDVAANRLERFEKNRLVIVLEIQRDGRLRYDDGGQKKFLPESPPPAAEDPRDAAAREEREDREVARWVAAQKLRAEGKDLVFVILYPRVAGTGRPTEPDLARYRRWFPKESTKFVP